MHFFTLTSSCPRYPRGPWREVPVPSHAPRRSPPPFSGYISFPRAHSNLLVPAGLLDSALIPKSPGKGSSTVRPSQMMPNVSIFPGPPDQSLGITNIFAIGAQTARDDSGKNEHGYILIKAYLQKQQQARICPRAVVCGLLPPETCRGPCSCPAQTPSSGC